MHKTSEQTHKFFIKISQESHRLCEILDSCMTSDQLENAFRLTNNVVERWDAMSVSLPSRDNTFIAESAKEIVDKLSKTYNDKNAVLNGAESEPSDNNVFIVRGFHT